MTRSAARRANNNAMLIAETVRQQPWLNGPLRNERRTDGGFDADRARSFTSHFLKDLSALAEIRTYNLEVNWALLAERYNIITGS